jgi:hypothetical protein
MLDRAREKNVYDELVQGELTEYLRGRGGTFDLIVSADTLVYFGDLEDVVAARCRSAAALVASSSSLSRTPRAPIRPLAIGSSCTAATAMPALTSNASWKEPGWSL